MDVCEKIDLRTDGEVYAEYPCATESIGMLEDGSRVCERHGRAAALEDIAVTWDKAP